MTSIEYVSNTKPIPRDKALLAVAHAQAAELFGMQVVYLETGSGAEQTVPPEMIRAVVQSVALPVIVGGGINTPKSALAAVKAGARAIVVGTAVEREGLDVIRGISQAIRRKR
jgi:putative glycerol-1-phosphate prenyltransferase